MDLIEIYIQEVTRRLPENNRSDIALELRSTIEDSLPNGYNQQDVKAALEKLGNPVALANGYQDRPMYLIGPRYFDMYVSLLKMIIPIAIVIALITIGTEFFVGYSGEGSILGVVGSLIGKGIVIVIEVAMQVLLWVTIIFAIIERTAKDEEVEPLTGNFKKWTADDLMEVSYIPKKKAISKFEVFGSLMWTAIWGTLYLYANQVLGVYETVNEKLQFVIPAFNQEVLQKFWPLVIVLIGLEIAFALYKLFNGQWTKQMAIWNTFMQITTSVLFIIILTTPNLINKDFLQFLLDLFKISSEQLNFWIIGSIIVALVIGAAVNIYDGFKKARAYEF